MIVWIGKRSDAFRVHKTIDEISKEERLSGRSSCFETKWIVREIIA